jgi:hypothetical protein
MRDFPIFDIYNVDGPIIHGQELFEWFEKNNFNLECLPAVVFEITANRRDDREIAFHFVLCLRLISSLDDNQRFEIFKKFCMIGKSIRLFPDLFEVLAREKKNNNKYRSYYKFMVYAYDCFYDKTNYYGYILTNELVNYFDLCEEKSAEEFFKEIKEIMENGNYIDINPVDVLKKTKRGKAGEFGDEYEIKKYSNLWDRI